MKYREWLEEWLEDYIRPASKTRTYLLYRNIAEKHLMRCLGDYDIKCITQPILQKYVSGLTVNGNLKNGGPLSSGSVNSIINVIRRSLDTAHALGYVPQNCADILIRPRRDEKQVTCFTIEEQKKIEYHAMRTHKNKMRGVIICLYTGLRIGELLALDWEDIDLSHGTVSVSKSCHDGINSSGMFCKIIESPKTVSSSRTIPIPEQLIPMLLDMKKMSRSGAVISGYLILKDLPAVKSGVNGQISLGFYTLGGVVLFLIIALCKLGKFKRMRAAVRTEHATMLRNGKFNIENTIRQLQEINSIVDQFDPDESLNKLLLTEGN